MKGILAIIVIIICLFAISSLVIEFTKGEWTWLGLVVMVIILYLTRNLYIFDSHKKEK